MLVTTLEKFEKEVFEKGKMEGKIEGKMEGKMEAACKMLSSGMERKEIARILEIGENDF